jgi:hypothetical protein
MLQINGFFVSLACCGIIVFIFFSVIDGRLYEPSIELPMIKEYKSVPSGLSKTEFEKLQWHSKEVFPL